MAVPAWLSAIYSVVIQALGIFNNNDRKALQKEIKSVKTEHDRLKKAEKKKADAEKKLAKKEEKKKKK